MSKCSLFAGTEIVFERSYRIVPRLRSGKTGTSFRNWRCHSSTAWDELYHFLAKNSVSILEVYKEYSRNRSKIGEVDVASLAGEFRQINDLENEGNFSKATSDRKREIFADCCRLVCDFCRQSEHGGVLPEEVPLRVSESDVVPAGYRDANPYSGSGSGYYYASGGKSGLFGYRIGIGKPPAVLLEPHLLLPHLRSISYDFHDPDWHLGLYYNPGHLEIDDRHFIESVSDLPEWHRRVFACDMIWAEEPGWNLMSIAKPYSKKHYAMCKTRDDLEAAIERIMRETDFAAG